MPDIIHLLPDSVANQIAAGEVIQRPASAVKELLENAIDSGASQIDLMVKDAGKTLIQVTDNGCGMSETDARLAFERHATSKISKVDDLFAIKTMGFRGEALASIAAIAQVELKSKLTEEELGTCLTIEGTMVKGQEVCQCQSGTSILVKNLFFNVPARRKFLKSNNVELRNILEEFQRVALAHPGLSFNLFNERKTIFQLKPTNLKQRIVSLFGHSFNQRLIPVEQKMDILSINGFIGKPEFAKRTRGEQYFFVNSRFMRHPYLNHAVDAAYDELLPEKTFPAYFIFIEIDPQEIDINIHPTKTEIKFQDEKLMYSVLRSAVKAALGKYSVTPSLDFEVEPTFDFRPPPKGTHIVQPQIKFNPDYNPFDNKDKLVSPRQESNRQNWEKLYPDQGYARQFARYPGSDKSFENEQIQADFTQASAGETSLFQVHRCYILSQVKSGIMLVDQQKAHERILYERYLELLGSRSNLSQQELFPIKLNLSAADAELLNEILNDLNLLGFGIKADGKKRFQFLIDGTPAGLAEKDAEGMIHGILENYKSNLIELNLDKRVNLARSMAKNLSIKTGKVLQQVEMKNLIDELFACKMPEIDLDGGAIITMITLSELDQRFRNK
jgi:DNA mismatch repair protein MutL